MHCTEAMNPSYCLVLAKSGTSSDVGFKHLILLFVLAYHKNCLFQEILDFVEFFYSKKYRIL